MMFAPYLSQERKKRVVNLPLKAFCCPPGKELSVNSPSADFRKENLKIPVFPGRCKIRCQEWRPEWTDPLPLMVVRGT